MNTTYHNFAIAIVAILSFCFTAKAQDAPIEPSQTLPILYVNTLDSLPVTDKVNPKDATVYITIPDGVDGKAFATAESPAKLTIRGRGNSSWEMPKKPYKLKFDKKSAPLGLAKNKHFALMAYASGFADWHTAFASFEFARQIGLGWAPEIRPVELMLNGNYEGLYFLTETVRIDPNRLDIYEQPEGNTDEATIPYGWLVEMDNTFDEAQFVIQETPDVDLRITHHSPELLSDEQHTWIVDEFTRINQAIYNPDSVGSTWADHIDAESFVKYFIIRESLHDYDGFSGSVYLHRDSVAGSKWTFGPLWDPVIGNIAKTDWVRYDLPDYAVAHWVEPIASTELFRETFADIWQEIYPSILDKIDQTVDSVAALCEEADSVNYIRWKGTTSASIHNKARWVKQALRTNMEWINDHLDMLSTSSLGSNIAAPETAPRLYLIDSGIAFSGFEPQSIDIADIAGRVVARLRVDAGQSTVALPPLPKGIYIATATSPFGSAALKFASN